MAAKLNPHMVNLKTMPLPLTSYILPGSINENELCILKKSTMIAQHEMGVKILLGVISAFCGFFVILAITYPYIPYFLGDFSNILYTTDFTCDKVNN